MILRVGMPQPGYFPSVAKVSSAPGQGSEQPREMGPEKQPASLHVGVPAALSSGVSLLVSA